MKLSQKLLIGLGCVALVVSASAALPTYKTVSAYGNAAGPATAFFPADPNSQVRVVGLMYSSDTNIAQLQFSSGTTALWQTATNQLTSSVTNQVNSTNGLSPNCLVVLQHNGACYTNTVLTWNQSTNVASPYQGTNIVLATGGWGVAASAGDDVFVMSSPTGWTIGSGTNAINGDAIYVGNYGRPVEVQILPASSTNRISAASAHYDSASQ